MVIMENHLIRFGFDKRSGAISLLQDRYRDIYYINELVKTPFRLEIGESLDTCFRSFSYSQDKNCLSGQAYKLEWIIEDNIRLIATIELADDSDMLKFTSRLKNNSEKTVLSVEYPIIGGINRVTEHADYLAHPYATGILIKDPIKNFIDNEDGLRFMPYPESFSGASMQFITYYGQNRGGLYCAAYDGDYRQKWLNAYKMNGKLEISLMYGYEDIGAGKDLEANFVFVLKMTNGDGWYEAADLYKEWAIQQKWCQKGPLNNIPVDQKAEWLHEEIGLCTFGINGMYDRTKWIKKYHDTIQTPIFHILGPDWTKTVQNFYSGIPGGYEDWFPTRFSKGNLELIKDLGDRFAPFEFDFLVDPNKSDSKNLKNNLQVFPLNPRSHDEYKFNMLCPGTKFTQDFHVKRDVQVYREAKVDSMYYDISANNIIKTCMSAEHNHPVGGGQVIAKSYKKIYDRTKKAISREAGKYIPLGTEMINEVFVDVIDYYQARAWAQPSSALETWPLRHLMKSGEVEMIPLFTYVYNEYGPVRIDGWGKLVKEIGDLYYHTVAKVYLWGGIYELNYEYSPMEVIDGLENSPKEHYYHFKPRGFEFDEERAQYLSQYASLRTGYGNKYLSYGIMQRPLDFNNPLTEMEWFHYNHVNEERGSIEVPSIVNSVWKFRDVMDESLALFFANTTDLSLELELELDIQIYDLQGKYKIVLMTGFGANKTIDIIRLGHIKSGEIEKYTMKLEPRQVYMLEIYR